MTNNQEFFCNHCKRETLFFLESDLLWYCDECGNVLDSIPKEEQDSEDELGYELEIELDMPVIRCPVCNNLVRVDEVVDGLYCPICFEDLSEKLDEVYEEDED